MHTIFNTYCIIQIAQKLKVHKQSSNCLKLTRPAYTGKYELFEN